MSCPLLNDDCQELIWKIYFENYVLKRIKSYPFKHIHILDDDKKFRRKISNTPFILSRHTIGKSYHEINIVYSDHIEWQASVEYRHTVLCHYYYNENVPYQPRCYKGVKMTYNTHFGMLEIGWRIGTPGLGDNGREYTAYQVKSLLVQFWKDCNACYIQRRWKRKLEMCLHTI